MNRTPPDNVLMALRQEVGFGCPVLDCGSPYLTWHHFDPPWNKLQHHNPEGMIALCREHHDKADSGAFTTEQLKEMKRSAQSRQADVKGRFDWMRRNILGVVGGCFYYETPNLVVMNDRPIVWWNRDGTGNLLLNVDMPTISGEERIRVRNNFFMGIGKPKDLRCPPSGKSLSAVYPCGDALSVTFKEFNSYDDLEREYFRSIPGVKALAGIIESYPVTGVEVVLEIAGTGIMFGPKMTKIRGHQLTGCISAGNPVGFRF